MAGSMNNTPTTPFTNLLRAGTKTMQQAYPGNPKVTSKFYVKDKNKRSSTEVAYFSSSNIKVAAYDHKRQVLNVTFLSKGNPVYEYYLVPADYWNAMKRASSVGRYFYFTVRDRFAYRKI